MFKRIAALFICLSVFSTALFCSACANNANSITITTSEVGNVVNHEVAFNKLDEYSELGYDLTNKIFSLKDFKSIKVDKQQYLMFIKLQVALTRRLTFMAILIMIIFLLKTVAQQPLAIPLWILK